MRKRLGIGLALVALLGSAGIAPACEPVSRTIERSSPVGLKKLTIHWGKRFAIDVGGLPVCHPSGRDVRGSIEKECADAEVGGGQIQARASFPGQPAIPLEADLHLYNLGRDSDTTTLALWSLLPAPISAEISVPLRIHRTLTGMEGTAKLPDLPGDSVIIDLSFRLRKGILTSRCPSS